MKIVRLAGRQWAAVAALVIGCLTAATLAVAAPVVQRIAPEPDFRVPLDLPLQMPDEREAALARYEGQLRAMLQRRPGDPQLRHDLGIILYHQGKADEARDIWTATSREDPNLPSADLMADLQDLFSALAKGDTEASRTLIRGMEERHAADPHFHLARAEQAERGGNLEEARKSLLRAVELAPGLPVTHLRLGQFEHRRGALSSAREAFERAVAQDLACAACWRALGTDQLQAGDVAAARDSFRKARDANPLEPLPEVRLAALSAAAGDLVGARHWYTSALAADPPEADAIRAALSDVLVRLNRLDEARAEIEAILATHSDVPALLVALGYIEERSGDPDAAAAHYRRAWSLSAENVIANNNLAMLLIRTRGSPEEAVKFARIARLRAPQSAEVLATFVSALLYAEQYDIPSATVLEAVRRNPDDPWLRYFYGKLLRHEGMQEESRVQLEGAVILDPAFPHRAEIESLLGN